VTSRFYSDLMFYFSPGTINRFILDIGILHPSIKKHTNLPCSCLHNDQNRMLTFTLNWFTIPWPLLYVKTNLDAPQHKVVTVDLSKEEFEIRDFIPEVKNAKLVQVNCVNKEYFVAIYKRDVIQFVLNSYFVS
jgi:hypothetical protein